MLSNCYHNASLSHSVPIKIGKNYNWLLIEVEKFGFKPEEALLVTYDGKGQIFCQKKENKKGN